MKSKVIYARTYILEFLDDPETNNNDALFIWDQERKQVEDFDRSKFSPPGGQIDINAQIKLGNIYRIGVL